MAATFWRRSFLQYKNSLFKTQYRTSYVVLIPEAVEDAAESDLFFKGSSLVDFNKVQPKDFKQLMVRKSQMYDIGSWELGEQITEMLKKNEEIDFFKHILGPLDLLYVPFYSAWGLIFTLHHADTNLMPAKLYHPVNDRAVQIRDEKWSIEPIYNLCKEFLKKDDDHSEGEKRLMRKFVNQGIRNGLELDQLHREELYRLKEQLEMRIDAYNDRWFLANVELKQVIDSSEVIHSFPPDLLRYTALDPEKPEQGPWILSPTPKISKRYMEYCDSRQARLHMWLSQRQICSKHGDARFRSDLEVEDIRRLKREYAKLLGFESYAHMVVQEAMAEKLENIEVVLTDILKKAKVAQEIEVYELDKFARERNFLGQIELWDIDFWGRLQKKELFEFDELALQEYFPLGQVLLGLFALCEQLFGIIIEDTEDPNVWHPDVRHFRVLDEGTKAVLGEFYFDPYARRTKKMDAFNGGITSVLGLRSRICNTLPCAGLIFDFAPPTDEKPSLLLFREVENLFAQFGAALQIILCETELGELNLVKDFERDSASVCMKFLKHWLYEPGTLESVSGHYNTGEPIPGHILEGICRMQHHLAGTKLCEKIYMANLDFQLHLDEEFCMPIVQNLWPEHFVFDLVDVDHHPFSLKDIFTGNAGCTYYEDIWSSVIAADAFSAFAEIGFKNHQEIALAGKRFRSTYYALAGGCKPGEVFRRFRGRDPSITPLLDITGLTKTQIGPTPETETKKIAA